MEAPFGTSQPLIERRRFPRINNVDVAVQFRDVLKPSEPFVGCLCKNVSASGARLTTDVFLPKESRLVVLVSMPPVLLKPIRLIGRVAWSKQQSFGGGYDLGIHFVEVTAEDKKTIADFVEGGR